MLKIYGDVEIAKLNEGEIHHTICHYCECCNTEHIGIWRNKENDNKPLKISLDRKKLKSKFDYYDIYLAEELLNDEEVLNFFIMKKCPLCGEDFKKKPGYHLYLGDGDITEMIECAKKVVDSYVCAENGWDCFRKDEYPNVDIKEGNIIQINGFDAKIYDTYSDYIDEDNPEDYFSVSYYDITFDSMLKYFRYRRRSFERLKNELASKAEVKQKIIGIIENSYTLETEETNEQIVFKIKSDVERLKKYLSTIYILETNKLAYSKRLEDLYSFEEEAAKDTKGFVLHLLAPYKEKIKKLQEERRMAENIQIKKEQVNINSFSFKSPVSPEKPQKPYCPTFTKPRLFNRKKILAENAIKEENYNIAMKAYEEKMKKYNNELNDYNKKLEELEQQKQNRYDEACKKAQENFDGAEKEKQETIKKIEKELQKSEMEYDEVSNEFENRVTPAKEYHELIKKEICMAEEQLKETCKTINQLYQYNIVYEKYRDIVAISSFYEYLMSGRCDKLEGMGGAYNIYESEIRANTIIGQLSKIEKSLEDAKQNQYMVYSALSKTNESLIDLNCKMNNVASSLIVANKELVEQSKKLNEIENNTAITTYNTAMTAFYAKKNTELTNSLGFLLAM